MITRHGDSLDVTLDGERVAAKALRFESASGGGKRVWIESRQESERSVEGAHQHQVAMKWVMAGDGEADGEPVEIRIESAMPDEAGEDTVMVFVGNGNSSDAAMIAPEADFILSDSVTYRCPADGTVLRMDRDKATQESYLCPVCGRVMERTAVPHVKVLRIAAPPAAPLPPAPSAPPAPPAPRE